MNIRHLEHLLAVADTGSFSRAAQRLCITQSALSRSVQNLEEELGGRLLDRIGKRNELTPLGRTVVAQARSIVREATELIRAAALFQQRDGGEIRVGLGAGPAALLMTPFLCHMAEHHPHVHVTLLRGAPDLQLTQLRSHQLEALVVDPRHVPPAPDLVMEQLGELRACFLCRKDHPLAQLPSVSLQQILAFPVASAPLSDEVARLLMEQYGPDANPAQMANLQCEDVGSLLAAVERTYAVFLGIAAAARDGMEAGRLVELPITPAFHGAARFAYVRLQGRTEAPAMRVFRDYVSQHLK